MSVQVPTKGVVLYDAIAAIPDPLSSPELICEPGIVPAFNSRVMKLVTPYRFTYMDHRIRSDNISLDITQCLELPGHNSSCRKCSDHAMAELF